jgi:ABC-type branched-subunit amino acid transport system substrate-binding protein
MRALAGPALEGAYVPLPAPLPAEAADPGFAERYLSISNGVQPGAYAVLAYDAANAVFAAMERSAELTREEVAGTLGAAAYQGLSGTIWLGAAGDQPGGRVWVYRWENDALARQP